MAWELFRGARVRPTRRGPRLNVESLETRELLAAFTPGNLVLYRVGDGAAALSDTATAVFLDEYTPAGALVQSIALPTTDLGTQQTLTASGTATSEGLLNRSANGRYLLLGGYDAPLGTASVAESLTGGGTPILRVIGRAAVDGTVDTSTTTTSFGGGNIRSVTSTDGTDIWASGSNTGVIHTTFGASGAGTLVSSTFTNLRNISVVDTLGSQLYVSADASTLRLGTVGTGTPTTTGQTITNLPGLPTASYSPYGHFFADLDAGVAGADTLYLAADDVDSIRKYSLVAGSWVENGTAAVSGGDFRGLVGSVSGTTVTLYATGDNGTDADTLVRLVDTSGYNANFSSTSFTLLATAATNTAFRGVAFTPESGAAPNTAPSLDSTGDMTLAAIDEDVITSPGTLVTDLIASAGGDRITDPNTGAVEGIAVVAVDNPNGVWHFTTNGGLNWIPFGVTTSATARLLAADASTRVRFVPNADFNGTVSAGLTFRAWDQTAGFNGNVFEITATGGTTPFSTDTETASITLNPINDAPALDNAGSMALTALTEDPTTNPGDSVIALLNSAGGDRVTDPDAGAVEGIAVTSVDNTNGAWEYSTDGGTTWVPFGSPMGTTARLLAATATNRIRFIPNASFSGTVGSGLSFRAWDQTTGTSSGTGDVTANGGTTAFSSAVETVAVTVDAVNDAPVLDGSGTMFLSVLTEDPVTNPGTLVSGVIASAGGDRITDADSGALEGIAVTFADNANGTWQFSLDGGGAWTPFGSPTDADARLLAADARVRFVPNPNFTGTIVAGLTFVAWDRTAGVNGGTADVTTRGGSTAFSVATASAGIAVNAVNDGPVNNVPAAPQTVQAGNTLVFSGANGISVTDVDAGVGSLRVTLTATNGVMKLNSVLALSFSTGDGDGDATMTFTGTRAAINAALAGMTYRPTDGFTGAATLQILANDQGNTGSGTALADGDTVNITVSPVAVPPQPPTPPPTPASLPTPELFTQYARIGRGRVRRLRFGLVNPLPVPLRLLVRIPLRRAPGTRRVRFITGLVTINAGETAGDFVFRVPGTPIREPLRLANVEVNDAVKTMQQTLGF